MRTSGLACESVPGFFQLCLLALTLLSILYLVKAVSHCHNPTPETGCPVSHIASHTPRKSCLCSLDLADSSCEVESVLTHLQTWSDVV